MMIGVYDEHGIRFRYPTDWEVEVETDGPRTTVAVNAPDGVAFVLVSLDEDCPEPSEVAGNALDAMHEEYPDLDSVPVLEMIDGHRAIGHDVEFLTLDSTNACSIRCYRTPRRTVFLFGQWSDLEGGDPATQIRLMRDSMEETDS